MMLAEPTLQTIKGVVFKVEGFTQQVQDAFQRYWEHYTFELIKRSKGKLGDEYAGILYQHVKEVDAGKFLFGTQQFIDFIKLADKHLAELLWYCLSKHQPIPKVDVEAWISAEPLEAVELFKTLMRSVAPEESLKKGISSDVSSGSSPATV